MKSQPSGYRDYDQWNESNGLKKGRTAITNHLHDSLKHWRNEQIRTDAKILDLYQDLRYPKIPIFRVPDLSGLGSVRRFEKSYGMQVCVFSNDHPPPHIHVDFLDNKTPIRVGWPSLAP